MRIVPLSALSDNYIWAIVHGDRCTVVDPGVAAPVERLLKDESLTLDAILVTHHHDDHIGGVPELAMRHRPRIFGPADPRIGGITDWIGDGERLELPGPVPLNFTAIAVPGHTRSHIAYFGEGALFCGDTLFSAGCGRLFEGTPAQMFDSLSRLAALPHATRVCCAHEYTLANLAFAATVEPDNRAVTERIAECQARRTRSMPTLPSTIGAERSFNPFLRCGEEAVRAAAVAYDSSTLSSAESVFATLRAWKNVF